MFIWALFSSGSKNNVKNFEGIWSLKQIKRKRSSVEFLKRKIQKNKAISFLSFETVRIFQSFSSGMYRVFKESFKGVFQSKV